MISGTSADGIDVALLEFAPRLQLIAAQTYAYPTNLREQLLPLIHGAEQASVDHLATLDAQVGESFARAARALIDEHRIDPTQIQAIGSHGQTIRHRPRAETAFTWQIGDPTRIVELTGITTVADFRRRDVAAGGQGAPLVPAFHASVFADPDEDRAVLNLGGIANFTLLPHGGAVRGFDTGPANALMDLWAQRCGIGDHDSDGAFAAQGKVDQALLRRMLADPWFALPPPKSSGREDFNDAWLTPLLGDQSRAPADVMATLLALTTESVAQALEQHQPETRRVLICGGGSCNPVLVGALRQRLGAIRLDSTADHGLDPNFVEAAAFAWLAQQTLSRQPGNLATVTGARGPRVLGAIYPA